MSQAFPPRRSSALSSAGGLGGECILLGQTQEGRYVHRILARLKALPKLFLNRHAIRGARIFYARNIDQLFLALLSCMLARRRPRVVYEVLDIQPDRKSTRLNSSH